MSAETPLPPGWKWVKIGDIVSFQYGKGLTKSERDKNGKFPVYGSNGIVGYHSKPLINEPALIVGRKGAAGAVHLAEKPFWAIDTTYYVIPPEYVNLHYLFYALTHENLNSLDRSTAIPGLNREDAYAQIIPLPPLDEQVRIVEKIEALFTQLDAGTQGLQRVQAALKRQRASVLKAAFEGRLVPPSTGDAGSPITPPDDLPPIPPGWKWVKVGDVTSPSKKTVNPQNFSDVPYIGMENIEAHTMRLLGTIPAGQLRSTADSFNPGDVLYGRLRPYLNKVFAPDFSGLCSTEFIVFRKNPLVYHKYLQYFLNQNSFVMFSNSLNAGDRPRVKFEQFSSYPFPLPPLNEQETIVAEIERQLSLITSLEQTVRANLNRVNHLRQAILKAAFNGSLLPATHPTPQEPPRHAS